MIVLFLNLVLLEVTIPLLDERGVYFRTNTCTAHDSLTTYQ